MRTVAIVQARMSSTRFPGKVLRSLAGKPVLWHVVHRIRQCRTVDLVAIATSTESADDAIERFGKDLGVVVVRGSETNVLQRYLKAARQLDADIVVRVTGDAPLVDPETVDSLVDLLVEKGVAYVGGDPSSPTINEGFSPFTRSALEKLASDAGDDPVAQEHVTAYFKGHPDFVPTLLVPPENACRFDGARISVDTPADLLFLEEVYSRLKAATGEADVREVVLLLRREPALLSINRHVRQKASDDPTWRVLIRCDGSRRVGLGHVVRCLALGEELRERHALGVAFAIAEGPLGIAHVQRSDFPVHVKTSLAAEADWLEELIETYDADALVLDVRTDLARSSVEAWRSAGLVVAVLDDASDRRLAADLAFHPPSPLVARIDWSGFRGRRFVGWDWVVLRREFAGSCHKDVNEVPRLMIAMGGTDPAELTVEVVKALTQVKGTFVLDVVVGAGYRSTRQLRRLLDGFPHKVELHRDVAEMWSLMAAADLAVASFGVTAYELAALGIPAIYICLTEDHAESAALFVQEEIGENLGLAGSVTHDEISGAVSALLGDHDRRQKMATRAAALVDATGVQRIARVLIDTLSEGLE